MEALLSSEQASLRLQARLALPPPQRDTPQRVKFQGAPSTLHRQSWWMGIHRECTKGHRPEGPDPLL